MEKAHEAKEVDLTSVKRGVWLVKVPKYLSDTWKRAGPSGVIGHLKITKYPNSTRKASAIFSQNQELMSDPREKSIPLDHKFVMSGPGPDTLRILAVEQISDAPVDAVEEGAVAVPAVQTVSEGRVSIAGLVAQRAECRPQENDKIYFNHFKDRMTTSNTSSRQVIHLETAVVNYKPKSAHTSTIEYELKKKEEGKKCRGEKDQVTDMLYAAFEKHQYYNVKDLVTLTRQPITFLKEILKEICVYNMKAPNKNTWELKSEYRHYKSSAAAEPSTSSSG